MKREERTVTVVTFSSSIHPEITTGSEELAEEIAWADANPVAWKIVRGNRSIPFGKNASTYMGFMRGDAPSNAIERVRIFHRELAHGSGHAIFRWRAKFTFDHYEEKGFKGGLFKQYDGTFDRHCLELDYTPATLDEVVDKFHAWCSMDTFATREIRLDGKTVRQYEETEEAK